MKNRHCWLIDLGRPRVGRRVAHALRNFSYNVNAAIKDPPLLSVTFYKGDSLLFAPLVRQVLTVHLMIAAVSFGV